MLLPPAPPDLSRLLKQEQKLTTNAIAIICPAATVPNNPDKSFHPLSLVVRPPTRIVIYATTHASSSTTLKFMKNPVLRHMEQK
jgi:hypothetical protein